MGADRLLLGLVERVRMDLEQPMQRVAVLDQLDRDVAPGDFRVAGKVPVRPSLDGPAAHLGRRAGGRGIQALAPAEEAKGDDVAQDPRDDECVDGGAVAPAFLEQRGDRVIKVGDVVGTAGGCVARLRRTP